MVWFGGIGICISRYPCWRDGLAWCWDWTDPCRRHLETGIGPTSHHHFWLLCIATEVFPDLFYPSFFLLVWLFSTRLCSLRFDTLYPRGGGETVVWNELGTWRRRNTNNLLYPYNLKTHTKHGGRGRKDAVWRYLGGTICLSALLSRLRVGRHHQTLTNS